MFSNKKKTIHEDLPTLNVPESKPILDKDQMRKYLIDSIADMQQQLDSLDEPENPLVAKRLDSIEKAIGELQGIVKTLWLERKK